MRSLLAKAATLGVTLLICFAVLEVVLRLFPGLIGVAVLNRFEPGLRAEIAGRLGLRTESTALMITPAMRSDRGPTIYMPGADSTFVMFADAVDLGLGALERQRMDRNGLCNEPEKATRGETPILLVGDSFVFCTGVAPDNTMSVKLEAVTRQRVYNLGVPATGPYEYLEIVKRLAPQFRPRVIIMSIYEGNDLRDLVFYKRFMETGQDPRTSKLKGSGAWSYAAQFISAGLRVAVSKLKRGASSSGGQNFRYSAEINGKKVVMNVTNRDQDEADYALLLQSGAVSLDLFGPPVKEFAAWARANGITPMLAYIPTMHTAYADTVKFESAKVGEAVRELSTRQRKWLRDFAATLELPMIDLTEDFQQAARTGVLTHFPANVHLTPEGHEIAARRFDRELRKAGIVQAK